MRCRRYADGENLSRPSASVFDHPPCAQCPPSRSLPFVIFCCRLSALLHSLLHCSNGLLSSFMAVTPVIPIALSDISSDIYRTSIGHLSDTPLSDTPL